MISVSYDNMLCFSLSPALHEIKANICLFPDCCLTSLRYRLPTDLLPEYYNITLWPHLVPEPIAGLYIFTGDTGLVVAVAMLISVKVSEEPVLL